MHVGDAGSHYVVSEDQASQIVLTSTELCKDKDEWSI